MSAFQKGHSFEETVSVKHKSLSGCFAVSIDQVMDISNDTMPSYKRSSSLYQDGYLFCFFVFPINQTKKNLVNWKERSLLHLQSICNGDVT